MEHFLSNWDLSYCIFLILCNISRNHAYGRARGVYPVPTQPFFCSPLLQCAPPYTQISGIVHLDSRSALHCCALAVCNLTGLNKVVQQQGGQKIGHANNFLLILRQSCCPRFDKCCLHFIMKQILTVFLLSLLNQVGNICK